MHEWKVVPLSKGQLLDVRPEHVLANGAFRLCDTYKAGGGYDAFPERARSFFGDGEYGLQFVVQLYGCTLDCPWCYVTRAGVWSTPRLFTSLELVAAFNETKANVFHLMGGAPAMYIHHWPELLEALDRFGKQGWVFHSDLMLVEHEYDPKILETITHPRALYAVSIKGVTHGTFEKNTRRPYPHSRLWRNLERLERAGVPYYVTFTNVPEEEREAFWRRYKNEFGELDALAGEMGDVVIDLIDYEACQYVDDVPWGGPSEEHLVICPESSVDIDPELRGGEPCVKGTRFPVAQVVAEIAEWGEAVRELAREFDQDPEAFRAALLWAAKFIERSFKDKRTRAAAFADLLVE